MMNKNNNNQGLYIHIPFCHSICPYCDFYKMVVSDKLKHEYILALTKELQYKKPTNIKTIYIGGGTPSALSLNDLKLLLQSLKDTIDLPTVLEFSIEVNPQDISDELLSLLKEYGITRISIGLQTMVPRLQKLINRIITKEELNDKLELLKKYNFNNFNLDLIYGIPSESLDDLLYDLNYFTRCGAAHLSCYSLILEEHTIFYQMYLKNELQIPTDDTLSIMYNKVVEVLKENGYNRYEVSNFSKDNKKSHHNLLYWNQDTYLGIGTASAYFDGKTRYKNTMKINDYITNINNHKFEDIIIEKETLSKEELIDEFIMLNLRKEEGFNINDFKIKYNIDLFEYYPKTKELLKEQYLVLENDYLKINSNFLYVSENIVVKLLLR